MDITSHMRFFFISYFLLSTMTITGCQKAAQETSIRDSKTIEIIQKANTFNDLFKADTITLKFPADLSIGAIAAINILPNDKIVIADDRYAKIVLLFDKSGNFLTQIGRRGQGPGEYTMPAYVGSTSDNQIIVADRNLYRITFFSEKGEYKSSFTVDHPIDQILISQVDEVIIHCNSVENTIHIYDKNGKLQSKFGRRSETTNKMWRILPFNNPGPFLAIDDENIFETDYTDYHIRKYKTSGKEVAEFGIQPVEWRSLTPDEYKPIPKGLVTAAALQQMRDFMEGVMNRCSLVWMVYQLKPGFIALLVNNRPKSGFSKQYAFEIYSVQGELIKSGLELIGFPAPEGFPRTYFHVSTPDKFLFSQYIDSEEDSNQKIRLIRFIPKI